jgi:hypothetical protein
VADGGRIISPSPNLFHHPWQVLDTAEVPQGAIFHLPGGLKISGGSSLKIGIHGRFFLNTAVFGLHMGLPKNGFRLQFPLQNRGTWVHYKTASQAIL